MKKIVSLFRRNYEGDRLVRDEVVEGAEWVLAGEGVATRKWDGTACLVRDGNLYKRYELKKGRQPPQGFEPAQEPDPVSGDIPGWVPVGDSPEDKWHREAWQRIVQNIGSVPDWTYELIGPKVQGNPEGAQRHILVPHGKQVINAPRYFEGIRKFLSEDDIEGIVWWRDPDDVNCDKVKIKARDFGLKR